MARVLRRPLARLFRRTVPAAAVCGFGAALVVAGVALPWVVASAGGWELAAEAEPVTAVPPAASSVVPPGRVSGAAPASGMQVAEATTMRPALVHVAGGTFLMGSPPGEVGRDDEDEAQHRVQVSSFVMCETEVTQAQFVAVAGALPEGCGTACGDSFPAHSVSWVDAADYLDALSRKEGLRPCYAGREGYNVSWDRSCDGYRLPTEAEWEFAARAGTTTAYGFGDAPGELCKHANGTQDLCDDGFSGLAPVGSFRANHGNTWNLLDMYGNVWEWVWDGYDEAYGLNVTQLTDVEHLTIDPGGPVPIVGVRVLRGGSFDSRPRYLRSAFRGRGEGGPWVRSGSFGFRCVRAALPQP